MADAQQISDVEVLQMHLARHTETCPVCDYSLHALTSTRCPECGAQLELRIGSRDRRLGPWVCALAGLLLPIGPTLMFLIAGVVSLSMDSTLRTSQRNEMIAILTMLAPLLGAYITSIAILIRDRRRFWRRSRRSQIIRAIFYLVVGPASLPMVILAVNYFIEHFV